MELTTRQTCPRQSMFVRFFSLMLSLSNALANSLFKFEAQHMSHKQKKNFYDTYCKLEASALLALSGMWHRQKSRIDNGH